MLRKGLLRAYGGEGPTESEDDALRKASIFMHLSIRDGSAAILLECPFLAIGSAGCAYNKAGLVAAGITHIICLADGVRLNYPDEFKYLRVSLEDAATEEAASTLHAALDKCFDFIEEAQIGGGRCLVHCFQGKSRSAAVCAAYLVSRRGYRAACALNSIRAVRPSAAPNATFMALLEDLERQSTTSTPSCPTTSM